MEYRIVSFSGGKDSTAMLLHMLELDMPIDEIIFCDTGMEFPQMYEHIAKVEKYIGREITILKNDKSFDYYFFKHIVHKKDGSIHQGYSFPSAGQRWCTSRLKVEMVRKHLTRVKRKYKRKLEKIRYVGIAADETKRIKNECYPLVDWGWTEADCLKYCYDKGFDWGGLYEIFHRLSCWCCPLQRLDELRKLRHNFPDLWVTLLNYQHNTWRKFKEDYTVDELETKFANEDKEKGRELEHEEN